MQTNTDNYLARVALKFARLKLLAFIAFLWNVVKNMELQTDLYKTPNPPLADVRSALELLETLAGKAMENKSTNARLARDAQYGKTVQMARDLASYVQNNCKNDVVNLTASGFEAIRRGSKIKEIFAPTNVRLRRNGNSGILDLLFNKSKGAVNYTIQTATKAEGPFQDEALSTTTRVQLKDRTPGTIYFVRIRANGAAGISEWTAPTSTMAV